MSYIEDEPAYPCGEKTYHNVEGENGNTEVVAVAIRDHFAGLALQAIITAEYAGSWEDNAKSAYAAADAMMAERIKR